MQTRSLTNGFTIREHELKNEAHAEACAIIANIVNVNTVDAIWRRSVGGVGVVVSELKPAATFLGNTMSSRRLAGV